MTLKEEFEEKFGWLEIKHINTAPLYFWIEAKIKEARIDELERVLRLSVSQRSEVFLTIPRVDITDKLNKLKGVKK